MGNWLKTDTYDQGELTVWLLEEVDGEVQGIYGDEDWACRKAEMDAEDSGEVMVVNRVTFRRADTQEVFRSDTNEPGEDEDSED